MVFGSLKFEVGAGIGVALFPEHGDSVEDRSTRRHRYEHHKARGAAACSLTKRWA